MTAYEIIAQAIGIVAMLFNILSYQQKSSKGVILMQLFGGALFTVSYFLLGAMVGALLNLLAVLRAVVYSNKEKFRADTKGWLFLFSTLFGLSFVLTFTVFGKAFTVGSALLEFLPVFAMVVVTIGFYVNKAAFIRKMALISCPCWFIYNIFNLAVGAMICDSVSLASAIIGIIRFDIKKSKS